MSRIRARFVLRREGFMLDADLDAPASGVTALFGPSGAGKTTLLRCIAGLERPDEGSLAVAGEAWQDSKSGAFLPPHRRRVGYVFQDAALFAHLTIRRNLEYGLRRARRDDRRIEFAWAVERLGLAGLLDRRPDELSGGQQKRAAVARALLASPRLLLLDEPLAGLDAAARSEILPALERLARELSIPAIYVSHDLEELAGVADHIALMSNGRIAAEGPFLQSLTRLDLPLARGLDAGAVLEAAVAGHDEEFGLTRLDLLGTAPAQTLLVPRQALERGKFVRVRVAARDVSLALDRPLRTSVLNVLEATVWQVAEDLPSQATVRLDACGATLLARVTRKSARQLALARGVKVYAQIKGVALVR